jgi:hypothetical protein
MRLGGERHTSAAIPPERPGTHCIGGWVGPRAGLEGCRKTLPNGGLDPWSVQPVARPSTDYAVPVHRKGGSQL